MQIYHHQSSLQPSIFKRANSIDSPDFLQTFNVYADQEKDIYYQLDPDTMADLVRLNQEFGYGYNIEFDQEKVLIFSDYSVFMDEGKRKNIFGFWEIINEQPSLETQKRYREAVDKQLAEHAKIFDALDLHLAKAGQLKILSIIE